MDYFKDPIFSNYHINLYSQHLFANPKLVNQTLVNSGSNKKIKILWADGFDYLQWAQLPEFENSLVLTNCHFNSLPPDISNHIYTVAPSYYGIYHHDYDYEEVAITKPFNCFMNRLDPGRQSWALLLVKSGLFDQGYVSVNLDVTREPIKNKSPQEVFEYYFQTYNSNFIDEFTFLKDLVPYKNFVETEDLTPIVLATKFSIIVETFFHDNTINTFSEKTFRCLQLPRPWVLFSTKGAVDFLKKLNFDVLDDLVDHSYDLIDNLIDRQQAILNLSKQLCELEFSNTTLHRCQQAAKHNKQVLKAMNNQWAINMENDLTSAKAQLLSLPSSHKSI